MLSVSVFTIHTSEFYCHTPCFAFAPKPNIQHGKNSTSGCIFIKVLCTLVPQSITFMPLIPFLRSWVSRAQWKGHLKSRAHWHKCLSRPCSDGLQLQAMTIHCSAHYALGLPSLSIKNIKAEWKSTDREHTQHCLAGFFLLQKQRSLRAKLVILESVVMQNFNHTFITTPKTCLILSLENYPCKVL